MILVHLVMKISKRKAFMFHTGIVNLLGCKFAMVMIVLVSKKPEDFGKFIVGHHMEWIISSIPPATDMKFKQSGCSLKFVKGFWLKLKTYC
ncbi:uncharacterized protein [Arachis hypogaea]|uniref:uncharacterized protein isoform X1 n=1 Tax=Arachis hypogaea TaxID=3818 RepID=UPI003B226987